VFFFISCKACPTEPEYKDRLPALALRLGPGIYRLALPAISLCSFVHFPPLWELPDDYKRPGNYSILMENKLKLKNLKLKNF